MTALRDAWARAGALGTRLQEQALPWLRLAWARTARRDNLPFAGLAGFWLAVLALQLLPLTAHGLRSTVMVLVVALVTLSLKLGEDRHPLGVQRGERLLLRLLAGLAAAQMLFCLVALAHPALGNVAATTLSAGHVLAAGGNPYAAPVDPLYEGPQIMEGYKLPPLTALVFLPLGLILGQRGVVLTNLLLQLGTAAAILALARGRAAQSDRDGALAAILYLTLPVVPIEIFLAGAPDLLPVTLTLLGLLLADRDPFFSGLAAGLSCSAGVMPGAAILPLCVPANTGGRERFLGGVALGLVPAAIYFFQAPDAFVANIFTAGPSYNGWHGLSPLAELVAETVAGLLWVGLGVLAWRHDLEREQRAGLAAIALLSGMLLLPVGRSGELLWWLPLGVVAVARPALLELTKLGEAEEARHAAEHLARRLDGLARPLGDQSGG